MALAIHTNEGQDKKESFVRVMMRLKDSSGDIKELVRTQIALEDGEPWGNLNGASYRGTIFKAMLLIVQKNVWLVFSDITYTSSLRKSRFWERVK